MRNSSILRIFVSLFFITLLYFIFRGEMGEIVQTLKRTHPLYFSFGVLLQLIMVCTLSTRLKLIFNAQGLPLSLKEAVELSFLGIFFNNFLPTAAGGDLPKAYFAYKKTKKKLESFACVVGDRFVGLFSLVLIAFIAIFFLWQDVSYGIKVVVVSLFLFSSLLISFLFNYRMAKSIRFLFIPLKRLGLDKKIEEVYLFLHAMSQNGKLLFQALLLSMTSQTLVVISIFFLIRGLAASESFIKLFVIFSLIVVVSMFPSLNGLGIREGAFVYFLGGSIGNGNALALSILFLAILGIQSAIGGIYYLSHGWRRVPLAEMKKIK